MLDVNSMQRAGVGFSMSELYNWTAQAAGNASTTTGDISEFLLRAGMTTEAVRNALLTISANVASDPQRVAVISDELRYLNTGQGIANRDKNAWVVPVLIVAALWFFSSRKE